MNDTDKKENHLERKCKAFLINSSTKAESYSEESLTLGVKKQSIKASISWNKQMESRYVYNLFIRRRCDGRSTVNPISTKWHNSLFKNRLRMSRENYDYHLLYKNKNIPNDRQVLFV